MFAVVRPELARARVVVPPLTRGRRRRGNLHRPRKGVSRKRQQVRTEHESSRLVLLFRCRVIPTGVLRQRRLERITRVRRKRVVMPSVKFNLPAHERQRRPEFPRFRGGGLRQRRRHPHQPRKHNRCARRTPPASTCHREPRRLPRRVLLPDRTLCTNVQDGAMTTHCVVEGISDDRAAQPQRWTRFEYRARLRACSFEGLKHSVRIFCRSGIGQPG
ncbi:MAG: hypothetical protein FLDDKLPJ_03127 [Phycisphaerae bacterium]|nr:hypothetical protein [Phycisphaerae bacterium]